MKEENNNFSLSVAASQSVAHSDSGLALRLAGRFLSPTYAEQKKKQKIFFFRKTRLLKNMCAAAAATGCVPL